MDKVIVTLKPYGSYVTIQDNNLKCYLWMDLFIITKDNKDIYKWPIDLIKSVYYNGELIIKNK